MAEFCLDCWNKINDTNDTPKKYVLSRRSDLCEECGEMKRIIISVRRRYLIKQRLEDWYVYLRQRRS